MYSRSCIIQLVFAGWVPYNPHDLARMLPGGWICTIKYYADPAPPLTTAGEETAVDDISVDSSDRSSSV